MTVLAQSAARLGPRFVYWLDGTVSFVMGVGVALLAMPLTAMVGWPLPAEFLLAIGLVLLPWAAFNIWTARAPRLPRPAYALHLFVDISWVIGSAALLLIYGFTMSLFGLVFIAGQGLAVAGVLLLKLVGARAMLSRA
ncbi:hypothetical protein [Devosia limi]|nr:hypothetical protein [Devosia limi]SHF99728.1 hypothetical protein SAMN02745223_04103 [Devosia limi DSM 17137]